MFIKKLPVYLVVFLVTCHLSLVTFSHAQDDFSDPGSQSVGSETSPGEPASAEEAPANEPGTSAETQDPTTGTGWSDDPEFTPATIGEPAAPWDGIAQTGDLDFNTVTPGTPGTGSGVDRMGEDFLTEGGGKLSPSEISELAGAYTQALVAHANGTGTAEAVAATGAIFDAAMSAHMAEHHPAGHLQNEISRALMAAEPGTSIEAALAGIQIDPGLSHAQVAAAVGGAMPDRTGYAAEFYQDAIGFGGISLSDVGAANVTAASLIQARGGDIGDIMGGVSIAYQTSTNGTRTGEVIAAVSINHASNFSGGKVNSPEFASAAFATGNTFGVNPHAVQTQLTSLGVSQNNIISGAVDQRTDPGRAYSNPAVTIGPNNAQPAQPVSPNGPPAAQPPGPPPAPPPAPAPAPAEAPALAPPGGLGRDPEQPMAVQINGTNFEKPDKSTPVEGTRNAVSIGRNPDTDTFASISISHSGGETRVTYTTQAAGREAEITSRTFADPVGPTDNQLNSAYSIGNYLSSQKVTFPGFNR